MTTIERDFTYGMDRGLAAGGIRAWLARYRKRRRFNRLLALDDRMLDDIGVTREEVEYASRLPLNVNAAIELRRLANSRRATLTRY